MGGKPATNNGDVMPQILVTGTDQRGPLIKRVVRQVIAAFAKPFWKLIPRSLYMDVSSQVLTLALTRKCNIDCVFCAYQYAPKEDKVHMKDDIFQIVLKSIKEAKIRNVMLSPNIGEPTLVPHFFEKLKALRDAGVNFIEMTTNGSLLHRVGIERMLKEGPDQINISWIGFDKELYERDARPGSPKGYEQTRANVLDILRMNQQLGRPKTINIRLRGDFGLDKLLAQPEMAEVRELADELAYMNEVDDWLGVITEKDLPEGYKLQKVKAPLRKRGCMMLYSLTVHPKGDIQVCACRNIFDDPGLHIGDIRSMSLVEAYAAIPKVLDKWEAGEFPESCRKCSMYQDPAYGIMGLMKGVMKTRRSGSQTRCGSESCGSVAQPSSESENQPVAESAAEPAGCGTHGCGSDHHEHHEQHPAGPMLYQIGLLRESNTNNGI